MGKNIPVVKAELLATVMETLLYGLSLPMFGGTLWALTSQRATQYVNRKILTVACALLLFSSVHFVIRIRRIMEGLILYRNSFPGGPTAYFTDISHWTFVSMNYLYAAQTLIGDGVVIYRCYAAWQDKRVMILPLILWCTVAFTGFACPYTESHVSQSVVFEGSLALWITSFWASTLTTNLLTTILLAARIWYVDRKSRRMRGPHSSQLRPILFVIIDAGVIYSVTLFAALICFVKQSNAQYVILDMVTPIISITFYMVIIRVGLARRQNRETNVLPLGYTTSGTEFSFTDRRSRLPTQTATEGHVDNGQPPSVSYAATPPSSEGHKHVRRSEIGFDEGTVVIGTAV